MSERSSGERKRQIPPLEVLRVHRLIQREWAWDLTNLEFRAVMTVFDRTYGWSKEWEQITIKQLTQGLKTHDGTLLLAPVSSDRTRVCKLLNSLVERGALLKRRSHYHPQSFDYAINQDWKPALGIGSNTETGIRSNIGPGIDSNTDAGNETHTQRGKIEESKKEQLQTIAGAVKGTRTPRERGFLKITKAVRSRRSLEKKFAAKMKGRRLRDDGSGFVPAKNSLQSHWNDYFARHFPDEAPSLLAQKLRNILYAYARAWTTNRKEGEFLDYIEFLFANWLLIRSVSLGWMNDAPLFPVPELIVSAKLRRIFEVAYANEERWDRLAKMNELERRAEELREKGMDPEKAKQIVAEEFGYADKLKELRLEKGKIKVLRDQMRKEGRIAQRAKPKPKLKTGGGSFADWIDE